MWGESWDGAAICYRSKVISISGMVAAIFNRFGSQQHLRVNAALSSTWKDLENQGHPH
jgi:predicted DNA-binding ArsR family transcriptional regulator